MKILTTVSEVRILDDQFEVDGLDVKNRYLTYELNEWDDYALEEAVQYAEASDEDVEVVTVTVGPQRAEETIRQGLAKGADRAIRVWDDALDAESVLGPRSKAQVLAAVVADEDPDLVLTGVQTGDAAWGATGVALAAAVDYAWAAVVNDLDLDASTGQASVHRELEGGLAELTDVDLPAVLTIQTGINQPRYASLRGIRQAQQKPLDVETLDDIGVDASVLDDGLELTALYEPESEGEATVFEGSTEEMTAELAALLREKGVGA
ncbi:electron transfer flavoprotein subunit beta/FixA family protein [Halorubellus litoreus]|uniref:Electron transfer flavoprotein subunit beta/FixA family protein n=1 Tax=Halorubellus litoreus TaxID=755308 RepID=A0ABD5VMN0_9EURY